MLRLKILCCNKLKIFKHGVSKVHLNYVSWGIKMTPAECSQFHTFLLQLFWTFGIKLATPLYHVVISTEHEKEAKTFCTTIAVGKLLCSSGKRRKFGRRKMLAVTTTSITLQILSDRPFGARKSPHGRILPFKSFIYDFLLSRPPPPWQWVEDANFLIGCDVCKTEERALSRSADVGMCSRVYALCPRSGWWEILREELNKFNYAPLLRDFLRALFHIMEINWKRRFC